MGQHCTKAVARYSILLFLSNFSETVQINQVKVPDGRKYLDICSFQTIFKLRALKWELQKKAIAIAFEPDTDLDKI